MRKGRRDLWSMVLCGVPVVLGVFLYLDYQSTGQFLIPLPAFAIPSFNLSDVTLLHSASPWSDSDFAQFLQRNLALTVVCATVGVLAAIMLITMVADFLRVAPPKPQEVLGHEYLPEGSTGDK